MVDLSIEITRQVRQQFAANMRALERASRFGLIRSMRDAGRKAGGSKGLVNQQWRLAGLNTRGPFPGIGYTITENPQVRDLATKGVTRMVIGPRTKSQPRTGARAGRAVSLQQGGRRQAFSAEYLVIALPGVRTNARGRLSQRVLDSAFVVERGGKLYLAVRRGRGSIRIVAALRKSVSVRNRYRRAFQNVGTMVARQAQRNWPMFFQRELRAQRYRGRI